MRLSQAVDGFLMFRRAGGLRPRTLQLYRHHLDQFTGWAGDPPLEAVKTADIVAFMAWLSGDYRPQRVNGDDSPLSSQSIYNTWTTLKAFTRWAHESLDLPDIMSGKVPRPRVTNDELTPFTVEEVRALLTAVKPHKGDRATTGAHYLIALRDLAIILTLLDTGLRASELCDLTLADFHLSSGKVSVTDGKGGKARTVWIGAHTRPAIWRYLQERPELAPEAPLFAAADGRPMTRGALRKKLVKIGRHAGVEDAHPHRYRYTFAIQYLRNGGDVFTLQALLGHTTMTMVRRYLRLAQTDVQLAHRRASPVDNWLK